MIAALAETQPDLSIATPSETGLRAQVAYPPKCLLPLAIILILGFVLRFSFLGSKPLWEDEAWTFNVAVSPQPLFDITGLDPHPLSFFAIYRALPDFFYQSDWAFRLPSAIFSCLALVLWLAALRCTDIDKRLQLWLVLAFAILPMNIRYAQEARAYALAQMLGVAAIAAYLWMLKKPNLARLVAVAIAVAASCHMDGFGLATPFVLGLHALWMARKERTNWRLVAAIITGTVLAAPYYVIRLKYFLAHQTAHSVDEAGNLLKAVIARLVQLSPVGIEFNQLPASWHWLVYLFALAVILLLAAAVRKPATWTSASTAALFWLLFVVPFGVLLTGSIVLNLNLIYIKYVLICIPGILPLIVIGALSLLRNQRTLAHIFLLLIPFGVSLMLLIQPGGRANWKALYEKIVPQLQPGDGFIQHRERDYPLYSFGSFRVYAWRSKAPVYSEKYYSEYPTGSLPQPPTIALDDPAGWRSPGDAIAIESFALKAQSGRVWTFTTGWMARFQELDLSSIADRAASYSAEDVRAVLWKIREPSSNAAVKRPSFSGEKRVRWRINPKQPET